MDRSVEKTYSKVIIKSLIRYFENADAENKAEISENYWERFRICKILYQTATAAYYIQLHQIGIIAILPKLTEYPHHVVIADASIHPQGYAAFINYDGDIRGNTVLADIGNGTMNVAF